VTALLNLAWVAAIFVPLERACAARAQAVFRPAWTTDLLFYAGQTLVFVPLVTVLLNWAAAPLRALSPAAFAALPAWVQAPIVLVLADLCAYWGHRAQHKWEFLWRFHAVHHTSRHVDWLAAFREHPIDGLYTQALVNLPAVLLGFDLRAWLGIVVLRGAWAIFVHSNTRLPLGPLKWVLGAPQFHRAHHSVERDVGHYANLAPWLDVVFGTHGPEGEPAEMGVRGPHPEGWAGLLGWGFLGGQGGSNPASFRRAPSKVETVSAPASRARSEIR
jgi:sterol desaturase/sphingolipid hydroxylase (fatty acid hydroxylase superfamily)